MSDHKAIREASAAAEKTDWQTLVIDNADLRALLADLDGMREALTKIANAYPGESGCYYTNRANISIARNAIKGASHD